jgi:integrase/recombinase XerD
MEIDMGLQRQAKLLSDANVALVLQHLETKRYPIRDKVMFLLSVKAGLRAKEIANLIWSMVTDADGVVSDTIAVTNRASKGKQGGREIPINRQLREALVVLKAFKPASLEDRVIFSERDRGYSAAAVAVWFHRLYNELGLQGASSHSGRRTFITKAAKNVTIAGGSLRDVQQLAGHSSLSTTQRYIEGSTDAKRKLVDLIA